MKAKITSLTSILSTIIVMCFALSSAAQEYDDMYFTSKDRKKKKKEVKIDEKAFEESRENYSRRSEALEYSREQESPNLTYEDPDAFYEDDFYNRDQAPVVNNYYGNVYSDPYGGNPIWNRPRSSFGFGFNPWGWSMGYSYNWGWNNWYNPYDPFYSGFFYDPFYDPFFYGPVYSFNAYRWNRPFINDYRYWRNRRYYGYYSVPVEGNSALVRRSRQRTGRVTRGSSISGNRSVQRMNGVVPNRSSSYRGRATVLNSGSSNRVAGKNSNNARTNRSDNTNRRLRKARRAYDANNYTYSDGNNNARTAPAVRSGGNQSQRTNVRKSQAPRRSTGTRNYRPNNVIPKNSGSSGKTYSAPKRNSTKSYSSGKSGGSRRSNYSSGSSGGSRRSNYSSGSSGGSRSRSSGSSGGSRSGNSSSRRRR